MTRLLIFLRINTIILIAAGITFTSQAIAGQKLTVDDAVSLALEHNRTYLTAQEEIIKANAEVTSVRSGALPSVNLTGRYNRNFSIPSFFVTAESDNPNEPPETIEFKTGFKNNFGATLSLRQPLWQGGRVFTALSIAKDYRKYVNAAAMQVKADVVLNAKLLYYWAILQDARLAVLKRTLEANSFNLKVAEAKFSQGTVSEFDLLRARVEKSNLQPMILRSESEMRLALKRLKSFIGIDLSSDIELVDAVEDISTLSIPTTDSLTNAALSKRSEILKSELQNEIASKAVKIAKADYYPSLAIVSAYDWQSSSDQFTLSDNESKSFTAGLALTIPIFQGGQVRGNVSKARSDLRVSELASMQLRDDIRLEVEAAYDRLIQAKETLEIQKETIAQAEEGLRIANLRYESGVGTQLEVLSAQTALSGAGRARAEALYLLRAAKASLKRATTIDF